MRTHRLVLTSLLVLSVIAPATQGSAQGLTINTVAGDRTPGSVASDNFSGDGGPAIQAGLAEPYGIAIDSAGNIYIADTKNHRIRKVTKSTGIISTVAGIGPNCCADAQENPFPGAFGGDGGPATSAALNQPTGVAVDSAGNIYIVDQKNHRIRKVNASDGKINTIAGDGNAGQWGTSDEKPATQAHLCYPYDVALDAAGNIYITDTGNMAVRKVTTDGKIHTFAGTGVTQCGLPGGFNGDTSQTATSALLDNPNGIAVDSAGNVYIADTWNNRVRKVTPGGTMTTFAGTGATTSKTGANYQLNPDGSPKTNGGYNGDNIAAASAQLNWPYGVAADGSGNVYISDYFNYRIRKVASGVLTTVAGRGVSGYDGDGGSSTAAFISDPANVNVDSAGHFYIVDQ